MSNRILVMQQHPADSAASTYSHIIFRCPQPQFVSLINESHVALRINSWSEAPGDAEAMGIDVFNRGRSQFTFATFNHADAVWNAQPGAPLENAFSGVSDPFFFEGTCDISAAQQLAPTVSDVTDAPAYELPAGMTTEDLRPVTVQASGCVCPSVVMHPDGQAYDAVVGCTGSGTPDTFWSAPNGWAVRQTTCGADPNDSCSVVRPQAFDNECTLRTEGVFIKTLPEFMKIARETTADGGSSTRTFAWSLTTVELASSDISGVRTVAETRTTREDFNLVIFPVGAVVETLRVGDIAPPLILSVQGGAGTVGGPSFVRCLVDSRTIRLVWQSTAYVQQPASAANTTLAVGVMSASAYTPVWRLQDESNGYSTSCSGWIAAPDETTLAAGTDSAVSCASAGCATSPQQILPAVVIGSMTTAAVANQPQWIAYNLKITCSLTAPDAIDSYESFLVPSGTRNV